MPHSVNSTNRTPVEIGVKGPLHARRSYTLGSFADPGLCGGLRAERGGSYQKGASERPADYLKIAASLVPRQMEIEADITGPTHEERVAARERMIAEYEAAHVIN